MRPSSNSIKAKLVVAGGFMLLFSIMGLICNCFSLSIVPITENLGFTRGAYSISQTLMFVCSAAFTINSSRVYKRFDPVLVVRIAVVVATAVFFLQSFATKAWMFAVSYCILGTCMAMSTSLPVGLIINEWIEVNPYTYIGIAMMGSGIGGAVLNPMLNSLISSMGWQGAYRIMALVMGAIAIPAAYLLLRRNPAALAAQPEREETAASAESPEAPARDHTVSFLQKRVVLIVLTMLILNCFSSTVNFSVNPQVQSKGMSADFAAMCSSLSMISMAAGKILVGRILDRKGLLFALYLAFSTTALGMLALAFFRAPYWLCLVFINASMMFGSPVATVAPVAASKLAAGEENMKALVGKMSGCITIGATLVPIILGNVFDAFGSYTPAYLIFIGIIVVYTVFLGKIFSLKLIPGFPEHHWLHRLHRGSKA